MGWIQLSVDTTKQPEWSILLNTNIKPIGNSAVEERFIKLTDVPLSIEYISSYMKLTLNEGFTIMFEFMNNRSSEDINDVRDHLRVAQLVCQTFVQHHPPAYPIAPSVYSSSSGVLHHSHHHQDHQAAPSSACDVIGTSR